jgi:TetR/AcrR family transcriptional repressor of nem operon
MTDGTREKIIQAAYARFYEFGYNGTSVQDIVDRVGVQKGTFYNYFKSKERLGLEALEYYACVADKVFTSPDATEVTATFGEGAPSEIERIRDQFRQAARFQEGPNGSLGCLMGNFAAESEDLPASFRKLISASFARWEAALAAGLARAQKKGEIARSHDPRPLGRFLMASWQGALLLHKNSKSRNPIDDFFHFTLDVLLTADATKAAAARSRLRQRRKRA